MLSTPSFVNIAALESDLLRVREVLGVHELHVWQLNAGVVMASVHLVVAESAFARSVLAEAQRYMHQNGIHNANIQLDVVYEEDKLVRLRLLSPLPFVWLCLHRVWLSD